MSLNPLQRKDVKPSFLSISNDPVEMDPKADGKIFQYALATEACLNLTMIIPTIIAPKLILGLISSSAKDITPAALQLVQWVGALTLALTPQLLIAIPNRTGVVQARRLVYYTLGTGEVGLGSLMLWQAFVAKDDNLGISKKTLLIGAANLGAILIWRYVALFGSNLMGLYKQTPGAKRSD